MWEMQVLTSSNFSSDEVSPTRVIEGGITDMDTSNDDKSDNELSVMDCMATDKIEKSRINSNSCAAIPNAVESLKIPPTTAASCKH